MKLVRAFGFAFQGVIHLFFTQWNARIHLMLMLVVCLAGWWLRISRIEWLVLILTCTLVISLEAINTAIEAAVDRCSTEVHPLAKTAKDVGAASVLIAAIGAVVIGCVIFIPHLIAKINV